jgi:hypothetical protein
MGSCVSLGKDSCWDDIDLSLYIRSFILSVFAVQSTETFVMPALTMMERCGLNNRRYFNLLDGRMENNLPFLD